MQLAAFSYLGMGVHAGWFFKYWKNHALGSVAALGRVHLCQDGEALLRAYRVSRKPPASAGGCPFTSSLPTLLYYPLLAESHSDPAGKAERGFVAPARQSNTEKGGFETKRQ